MFLREWRNWQTRTFEGRVVLPYGFDSRFPHQNKRERSKTSLSFALMWETHIEPCFNVQGTLKPGSHTPPVDRQARLSDVGCGYIRHRRNTRFYFIQHVVLMIYRSKKRMICAFGNNMQCFLLIKKKTSNLLDCSFLLCLNVTRSQAGYRDHFYIEYIFPYGLHYKTRVLISHSCFRDYQRTK